LVLSRVKGDEEVVYIANISDKKVRFHFDGDSPEGEYENFFTDERVLLPAGMILEPWDFVLLTK
jgi:hypothetical protein